MRRRSVLVCILVLAAVGCKDDKARPAPAPAATPPPAPAATPAAAPAPAAAAPADSLRLIGGHNPPKPTDPVVIEVPGIKVTRASFKDPKDLTGGSAELAIDLSTLDSHNGSRDEDLKGADYFDVARMATATVKVHDVTRGGADGSYKALADLDVHGISKTIPVEFQVTEVLPGGGVRIKGSQKLSRLDFKVGSPNGEGGNPTGNDVTVELELTIPAP